MTLIHPTRLNLLKSAAGLAATALAARTLLPGGAWAATAAPKWQEPNWAISP